MKNMIFLACLALITLSGCNKSDIAKGTPDCVESKISDFTSDACENDANVKEYTFQNKSVYVFDPGSCGADMTSEVIDSDCNNLGFLGGIAGNTQISGEDFSNAVFVKLIWTK